MRHELNRIAAVAAQNLIINGLVTNACFFPPCCNIQRLRMRNIQQHEKQLQRTTIYHKRNMSESADDGMEEIIPKMKTGELKLKQNAKI